MRTFTNPGVEVRSRIDIGNVAATIVRAASETDLIVMGAHGRGAVGRLLLGSVAQQVMLHAHCPVTTVRATTAH
jgi:nucleotide-binding universal stress UspA family protein